jgi:hypothetical protein
VNNIYALYCGGLLVKTFEVGQFLVTFFFRHIGLTMERRDEDLLELEDEREEKYVFPAFPAVQGWLVACEL